jgi:hypothetical protein
VSVYQYHEVNLNGNEQIVGMRLIENEGFIFIGRLKYSLQQADVTDEPEIHALRITFAPDAIEKRSIKRDANIYLDSERQMLGLEFLLAMGPSIRQMCIKLMADSNICQDISQVLMNCSDRL